MNLCGCSEQASNLYEWGQTYSTESWMRRFLHHLSRMNTKYCISYRIFLFSAGLIWIWALNAFLDAISITAPGYVCMYIYICTYTYIFTFTFKFIGLTSQCRLFHLTFKGDYFSSSGLWFTMHGANGQPCISIRKSSYSTVSVFHNPSRDKTSEFEAEPAIQVCSAFSVTDTAVCFLGNKEAPVYNSPLS
jgi:hypothetical protein